ncbi:unnamed protein product [Angiostrongylus costaricensis]|uniref:G_PROTEIN_RECEP_F1_2 domain-containing protein n=1 Tax=Angiostrongylus costaricensis TaxID=334426 RepID=A0A0R3PTY8_ANGCS|nr:unnamed protein product [Angiostrongylus costaricensis]
MWKACFVLVCALYERYLITVSSRCLRSFQNHRGTACVLSLMLALFTKGGIFFELDIFPEENQQCRNTVNEYYVDMTPINSNLLYGTIYRFWLRNIVTVFVPFTLLTLINFRTLLKLKAQLNNTRDQHGQRFSVRHKSKVSVTDRNYPLLRLVSLEYFNVLFRWYAKNEFMRKVRKVIELCPCSGGYRIRR